MRAALKVVRSGLHLDAAFVRRFREERQILARLDHPNVARLLDGGVTDDGRPYYVMEFVDGAPIDRWCDAPPEHRGAAFALREGVRRRGHGARARDRSPGPQAVERARHRRGEPKLLDFTGADALLRGRIETAPPDRRERAQGWLIKSLRMQERWPEALEQARRFRALDTTTSPGARNLNAVPEAQVLLESGRPREAAAIFDSVSRSPSSASNAAWHLTRMAGAGGGGSGFGERRDVVRPVA
ncbi:MAG TPA: hypothetical protein VFZ21_23125 [Gemmatimonadaceae bacterium]|jgi:hypothetical protein|nr:hypothetical protein [Gemmatimonadaceae bacterium]